MATLGLLFIVISLKWLSVTGRQMDNCNHKLNGGEFTFGMTCEGGCTSLPNLYLQTALRRTFVSICHRNGIPLYQSPSSNISRLHTGHSTDTVLGIKNPKEPLFAFQPHFCIDILAYWTGPRSDEIQHSMFPWGLHPLSGLLSTYHTAAVVVEPYLKWGPQK